MERDITQHAAAKMQGGWSASDFSKFLKRDSLEQLLPKFDKLDPLVRVRLLLSVLTLDDAVKQSLKQGLEKFMAAAKEDKEEWVSITAKALDNFTAPLDLTAVMSSSSVVKNTIQDLESRLETGDDSAYRPMEEPYLRTLIVEEARGGPEPSIVHSHFTSRDGTGGGLPELYQKASASAAAAAASVGDESAALPPEVPGASLRHQESGTSFALRQAAGMENMFRSSRPTIPPGRRMPSVSGQTERKGSARPVQVKLLDVNEVKRLNENEGKKKHLLQSPQRSNAAFASVVEDETEDGELEAGELCEDGDSATNFKRARLALA